MNFQAKDPHAVMVKLRHTDGYTCEIQAGDHLLIADEPLSLGGENNGVTPYQLLKAALGACTAMTMRMYAQRKEWNLQDVHVTLRHSRDAHKHSVFERDIRLIGNLTHEQRERLLEIAERCPVHKTLSDGAMILTKLIDQES